MGSQLIAGVDDATKCPVIGSIMVAGVVADTATILHWQRLGVKDSKLLTRKRRDELAKTIRRTAHTTSLREIPPALIDDKAHNLNMWEMVTVLQIVQNLRSRESFEAVLLDNWEVTPGMFQTRLAQALSTLGIRDFRERGIRLKPRTLGRLRFEAEHQADEKYTVVGAASILAKSASDRQYDRYRKAYGDFGSGNPGDTKTLAFLWKHRHDPCEIIRTSWKTFERVAALDDIMDDPLYARVMKKRQHSVDD